MLKPSSPHLSARKISIKCTKNNETKNCDIKNNEENFSINNKLTQTQENVLAACLGGENIFITGGAGTGKSSLLLIIVEKLYEKYGRHTVFVTATTGLAACAIGGTTVQQFAGTFPGRKFKWKNMKIIFLVLFDKL